MPWFYDLIQAGRTFYNRYLVEIRLALYFVFDSIPAVLLGFVQQPVDGFDKLDVFIFPGWNDGADAETDAQVGTDLGDAVGNLLLLDQAVPVPGRPGAYVPPNPRR